MTNTSNEALTQLVAHALSRWSPPTDRYRELARSYAALRELRAAGTAGLQEEHTAVARARRAREAHLGAEYQRLAGRVTVDLQRAAAAVLPLYGCLLAQRDPSIGLLGSVDWSTLLAELMEEPDQTAAMAAYAAVAGDPLPTL